MLQAMLSVFPFLFTLMVIYGALSDLSTWRIPNWVSYGLVLLFAAYTFLIWLDTPYLPSFQFRLPLWVGHVMVGLITFVISVVFWKLRFIGGGDVKYLTAAALWVGPLQGLTFCILMTGIALGLFVLLKFLHIWNAWFQHAPLPKFVKRLLDKAETNELPYGFPIGIATLLVTFQQFTTGFHLV
jgi:prepilin peptidase CpaA